MGINSYFILSSISWSGELGADAVEVRRNIEVMVPDPLAATFFNLLFFFLNAIFSWHLLFGSHATHVIK